MAYYNMVAANPGFFVASEFGGQEASLQTFVATFSGQVGAVAYLANVLTQEALPNTTYLGMYTYSQQVAESSMVSPIGNISISDELAAGRTGLLSDALFFDTTEAAW